MIHKLKAGMLNFETGVNGQYSTASFEMYGTRPWNPPTLKRVVSLPICHYGTLKKSKRVFPTDLFTGRFPKSLYNYGSWKLNVKSGYSKT